jgi:hypothetical protein
MLGSEVLLLSIYKLTHYPRQGPTTHGVLTVTDAEPLPVAPVQVSV